MQNNHLNNLQRNIYISNNTIYAETEKFDDFEYAFYLHKAQDIEKIFYKKDNKVRFKTLPLPGKYTATFFYKNDQVKHSYSIDFIINKNIEIVLLEPKVIIEDNDYKIDYYDSRSNITFVVFNETSTTKLSQPFARDYLLKKGFNVIVCFQDNQTEYQNLSFEDFQTYVSPLVIGKRVFTYGSSLGGYCAIYYAGAINATVIASAPMNYAHPTVYPNKFAPNLFIHKEIWQNEKTSNPVYIIFDPYITQDTNFLHKQIIPAYPKSNLIKLDFSGHTSLRYLQATDQLDSTIESIIHKNFFNTKVLIDCYITDFQRARYYKNHFFNDKAEFYAKRALNCDINDEQKFQVNALFQHINISVDNTSIQVSLSPSLSGENIMYAFYLMEKNHKIDAKWYTNHPNVDFKKPLSNKKYHILAFIKDSFKGYKATVQSNFFYM